MRSQAEFQQGLSFRQSGYVKSVFLLILAHGIACCGVPSAVGRFVEDTGLKQCLLDLLYSFGIDVHAHVVAVSSVMPLSPVRGGPAYAVCLSLLAAHQGEARYDQ